MSDYDRPKVFNITPRKARKEHSCYECDGTIRCGVTYFEHRGLWNYSWSTFKLCAMCDALASATDTYEYGTLHVTLSESGRDATCADGCSPETRKHSSDAAVAGARIVGRLMSEKAEQLSLQYPAGTTIRVVAGKRATVLEKVIAGTFYTIDNSVIVVPTRPGNQIIPADSIVWGKNASA